MQPLPKKLEDALRQARYKKSPTLSPEKLLGDLLAGGGGGSASRPADDFSFERGMLDSVLGRGGVRGGDPNHGVGRGGGLFPKRERRPGTGSAVGSAGARLSPRLSPRRPLGEVALADRKKKEKKKAPQTKNGMAYGGSNPDSAEW